MHLDAAATRKTMPFDPIGDFNGLIDTELWRVNLQHCAPVARFGASFYIHTHERFAMAEAASAAPATATAIDRM